MTEANNKYVLELYISKIIFTGIRMLKNLQETHFPLGSLEAELLYDCGTLTELTQGLAPVITDEFNREINAIQNTTLDRAVALPENRFVLSLNALDYLVAKERFAKDAARPVGDLHNEVKETLLDALESLMRQFDSVTLRRYLRQLEQEAEKE